MMQRDGLALIRGTCNTEVEAALREAIAALDDEWQDEAILACERALKTNPACAEAIYLLGLVAFDLDEPVRAIKLLEKAHELSPQVQEFAEALAAVQARLGKVGEALFYAKLATSLAPHPTIRDLLPERFGTFFKNLEAGETHFYRSRAERKFEGGSFQDTLEDCRRQLELTPGDESTLLLMARACLQVGRMEQSIAAFHAVLHGGTPEAEGLVGLADALYAAGRQVEGRVCQDAAEALVPNDPTLQSRRLARMVTYPGNHEGEIAVAHADWSRRHAAQIRAHRPVTLKSPDPERPLRVAYLSGALRRNDFTELFTPVLQGHRKSDIETYCYSDGTQTDGVTETLMQAATKWIDITDVDDETVWEILRGDEIDIAVDLSGHFEGGHPSVFARRAAPVSVAWLGYPVPPGIPAMDYFMTDGVTWPDSLPEPTTGEQIWRLSRSPFAYLPPVHLPPVGELPAAKSGNLTFGVNCDLAVITPARACGWAQLLRSLGGARLLVCNRFDQDQACIERVKELFSHFGLRDRVDVVNMADNFRSEFDFYHYIDLALDSGTAAAIVENCRALWMGVPVLGLAGRHAATRLCASLLSAAGRPKWCTEDIDSCVATARALTEDLDQLAALRQGLRSEVADSVLGDVAGLVRDIEFAYRAMWRKRCDCD